MDTIDVASLSAWTPVHVHTTGRAPVVDWALAGERFTAPFFEDDAHRVMQHPFNQVFARSTSLDVVDALRASAPGIAPAGFVFHMSRCGSTLISQMLSRLSDTIVVSEAQPLDALLRLRGRVPGLRDETLMQWLRGMTSALAQPRGGERRLFVKFNAWHVLELPFIASAFPAVPWVFVFREPRAVLASQARLPGPELFPESIDPVHLGIDAAAAHALVPEQYGARVIAAFCNAALRCAGIGRMHFVDYAGLPQAVFSDLLPFFGIEPAAEEIGCMRDVARHDVKARDDVFRPREADPRSAPGIEELASRWLDPPYAALCAAATAQRPG